MTEFFHTFLYKPLFNLLIAIYNFMPIRDIGIAIIILTVFIKIILWPFSRKMLEAQKRFKDLQPMIKEISNKYKDNALQKNQEIMRLYKENKANPASSCLPLLIQLPILWAIFAVFRDGFKPEALQNLYSFVHTPAAIDKFFLNIHFFDLSRPNIILTILPAILQFWQGKMLAAKEPVVKDAAAQDENFQAVLNKQMLYVMPIMTIVIGFTLPSGLMLYWLINTLLTIAQQWWQFRDGSKKKIPQET